MKKILCILILGLFVIACKESYTPKPKAFFRIELPPKVYRLFDEKPYPFTYEIPVYAEVVPYDQPGENHWANVNFPGFNATINLSYLPIKNNLNEYIADANTFVGKHQQKATGIFEKAYEYPEGRVYGVVFDIKGSQVASTYQFYLTDSVKHFVRGALYFNEIPRNDSLAPVITFLKADIDHLIRTFAWR